MVAGADADPVLVEDGGDVVRMDIAVRERHDARAMIARPVHRHTVDLDELVDRGSRERPLVLRDPLGADTLEVRDRRGEPDSPFDVRGARLELMRNLVVRG